MSKGPLRASNANGGLKSLVVAPLVGLENDLVLLLGIGCHGEGRRDAESAELLHSLEGVVGREALLDQKEVLLASP